MMHVRERLLLDISRRLLAQPSFHRARESTREDAEIASRLWSLVGAQSRILADDESFDMLRTADVKAKARA